MSTAEPQSLALRSLGDIAASLPGSTAIFRRHKLDFCCGGAESLERAARKKGLDPAPIAAELARLSPEQDPIPESVEDLIGYILERYHQVHRRELPELRNLAIRVQQVHAEHPAVPAGLSDLLARIQADLESHMQKEEQVLFPLMLAGGNPMIVHPIAMMRHEHDECGEELESYCRFDRRHDGARRRLQFVASSLCRPCQAGRGPDRAHPHREQRPFPAVRSLTGRRR